MERRSEQIQRIHRDAIVLDAHFDLLLDVEIQRLRGRHKIIETDYLTSLQQGGVSTLVCSLFIDNQFLPEMGLRKALNQISAAYAEVAESPDKLMLCKTVADVMTAKEQGKIGLILSLEGAEPLANDITLLRIFYELGVRAIGLVWSRRNYVGDGSHFSPVREGRKGGLTSFGLEVVEQAEALGMVVDVSHLNDEGFWDVVEIAKQPIIASHSNCRSLVDTMRNLTDEQIKAIAATGGVIGMNAASLFVAERDEDADLEHLLDHLDHIVKLVGTDHVGLGLDLCDHLYKYVSPESLAQMPRQPFDAVKGHESVPELTESLLRRGYHEEEIEQILGKNFMRVFSQVWK